MVGKTHSSSSIATRGSGPARDAASPLRKSSDQRTSKQKPVTPFPLREKVPEQGSTSNPPLPPGTARCPRTWSRSGENSTTERNRPVLPLASLQAPFTLPLVSTRATRQLRGLLPACLLAFSSLHAVSDDRWLHRPDLGGCHTQPALYPFLDVTAAQAWWRSALGSIALRRFLEPSTGAVLER